VAAQPTKIHVEVPSADALFDDDRAAKYPHTGRMLDGDIAAYVENCAREFPKAPSVEVEVIVAGPAPPAGQEDKLRKDFCHYYECEVVLSSLDRRVNRVEGIRSFTTTVWMLVAAGFVALLIYILSNYEGFIPTVWVAFVVAIVYLATITVVWVLFWDPFEKIVFTGALLKSRHLALELLSRSAVRFNYANAPGTAAAR
jgi:hypothetical protein